MLERTAFSKDLDIMDEFEALKAKFEDVSRALNGETYTRRPPQKWRGGRDTVASPVHLPLSARS
ncbi:hypothetical protein ASC97_21255 [Rhizobium sp. Root1203]|nr:hypothetical protein ASC97_21255 [Rhizobium sp. Root1203]